MSKKFTIIILTLAFLTIHVLPSKSTPSTSIYVAPETSRIIGIGQTCQVNISVTEVNSLWGWEISLYYNSTQLNCTSVEEGPFLKTAGETFFWIVNLTDNYNATHGYIRAFCALTQVIPGPSGNGQIAYITFKSKAMGESILDLNNTKLKTSDGEYLPHETLDGTIIVELGRKLGDLGSGLPPKFFLFDGKVDSKDLSLFLQCYKCIAPPEAMYLADLGGGMPPQFYLFDGIVDGKDLSLFLLCYKGMGPD